MLRSVDWPMVFAGLKTFLDPLAQASWPIALGIIVFSFRRQIASLLNRIKQVTGFGGTAEFTPIPAPDQQTESPTSDVPATVDPNMLPPNDPVFDPLDAQLHGWLDDRLSGDSSLKLAWAIRSRSISEATRLHEFNYRVIFGSQLQALEALNPLAKSAANDLRKYYDTAAANPMWKLFYNDRDFEVWTNFLVTAGYIHRIPETDPEQVEITAFGRQFLVWIAQNGLSKYKPA